MTKEIMKKKSEQVSLKVYPCSEKKGIPIHIQDYSYGNNHVLENHYTIRDDGKRL